jgi:hypothetical protein
VRRPPPTAGEPDLVTSQLAAYIIPTLGDRVEMARSIEAARLFDTNLAELTFRVPVDLQIDLDQLREKRLLHEALGRLLPPSAKGTRKRCSSRPTGPHSGKRDEGESCLKTI